MDVNKFISENPTDGEFVPYYYWDSVNKKLSVYLKPDEYFVENLTNDIEVFKSLEDKENQIVGCRLDLGGKFIQVQPDDFK